MPRNLCRRPRSTDGVPLPLLLLGISLIWTGILTTNGPAPWTLSSARAEEEVQKDEVKKEEVIPHGQSQPPGPPLSPEEALERMTVPEGFQVELVAAEPDLVNPVAMTFDEQGRIWVTESLEYPRLEAGPGRDRIKVLEDTTGDGKADKVTIFADGLNIPSGIAVGHGGVWVANSPDILFLQDTTGDGRADHQEVVVTGFGRADTHELPNSLTWGPDGYLYGLNGVFNPSHVKQGDREFRFTCALFRIDPRTREFELFAEGTSNPWGIAWDPEGSAFLSACVIDHLWHITETGYYHRQGGPYPPHTWKIESIVSHKHQKAAYCGIHYFDSDAYPEPYRDRLYMGNIHGNCINVDQLTRRGSTYFAEPNDDFLSANDVWFMPVAQKTGPDGCLYVLDWYDRYHCYQDARRDPEGIDRLHGRLYRIRYQDTPRAEPFDLTNESSEQLEARLHSPNVFFRDLATRLLAERQDPSANVRLEQLVFDSDAPRKTRLHALWALVSQRQLSPELYTRLFEHPDPTIRAWGVRAAGNQRDVTEATREQIAALRADASPDVQLQVVIAVGKIPDMEPISIHAEILSRCGDDPLIPQIVWQNLHPLLETQGPEFLAEVRKYDVAESPGLRSVLPRATERILGGGR
jgi:putative membrane-bound dehydrogenase-like protein